MQQGKVIEINLPNGSVALARVSVVESAGAQKTASLPKLDFEEVGKTLEGIVAVLKSALEKAAPDKVTVSLGMELAVKSGKLTGLLVEGEGKGTLGVTVEWTGAPPTSG